MFLRTGARDRLMLVIGLIGAVPLSAQRPAGRHPLDPLSAAELRRAASILHATGVAGPETRFAFVALHEPEKSAVQAGLASGRVDRAADAIMFDWRTSVASRATVDLGRGVIARAETLSVRHPPATNLILFRLAEAVRPDRRWRAAVSARGVRPDRAAPLPGGLGEGDTLKVQNGVRVASVSAYDRDAPPPEDVLAGIKAEVDLTNARVLSFEDEGSAAQGRVDPDAARALTSRRAAVLPPAATRTFRRSGSEIRWERWRLHIGFHPRRGLELFDVAWVDDDRVRPVLYRGSISEMIAPYGDPGFQIWFPRDEGDIGLGYYSRSSIVPFGDAPPNADLIDAVVADDRGLPVSVPRAIAVYERDAGVLWRHAGRSRRARQLVVTSMATVDNYDYAFEWIFGLDGSIDVEVRLTGIMNLRGMTPRDSRADHSAGVFGHQVGARIFAPNHQHFFNYRLDLDVDGSTNEVLELDNLADPVDSTNPQGLWFRMRERVLDSESRAKRKLDLATGRKWKVVNTTARNALGQPTGFTLAPGENALTLMAPSSPVAAQAGWLDQHIWVTRYTPAEMHAGGDYQRLDRPGDGLATWTRADRALRATDVVLWYTFGITHIPRAEDFPFMPAHRAGFRLVPTGFFARNPALDVPAPPPVPAERPGG
jgi:primary-amine oxidase